jgi:hypothetical protein
MTAIRYRRGVLSAFRAGNVPVVERTMWTDERLDERFNSIDRSLGEMRADIRELRMLMFQLWGVNMLAILVTLVAIVITRS